MNMYAYIYIYPTVSLAVLLTVLDVLALYNSQCQSSLCVDCAICAHRNACRRRYDGAQHIMCVCERVCTWVYACVYGFLVVVFVVVGEAGRGERNWYS